MDTHLANIISSSSFADDLTSVTNTIKDLKMQIHKLTLYSDWAALSGSKTKVAGALYSHPSKDANGVTPHQTLQHQLKGKIDIQNQKAQFIPSARSVMPPSFILGFSSPWISTGNTRSSA